MTKTEDPRQLPECLSSNGILPYFYAQCPYLTICFPFNYSTLPYCKHHTSKGVCFRRSLSIGVDVRFHQGRRRKRSQILLVVCDDGYIASTTSNMEELWEFASAFLVKQGNIGFFHGLYSLVKLTYLCFMQFQKNVFFFKNRSTFLGSLKCRQTLFNGPIL